MLSYHMVPQVFITFFSLFGLFVGLYMLNPGVMQSNLNFAIFLVVLGDKITINEQKAIG